MSRRLAPVAVALGLVAIVGGWWYQSTQGDYCVRNMAEFGVDFGTCEPGQGLPAFVVGALLVLAGAVMWAVGRPSEG